MLRDTAAVMVVMGLIMGLGWSGEWRVEEEEEEEGEGGGGGV